MYNVSASIKLAWQRLFMRVFEELGLDITVIEHRWPEPLQSLWIRKDLACAFMCGWPYARSDGAVQPIASPVPLPTQYAGLPRYRSEFLARRSSGWTSLEDCFGARMGWMVEDSQSGFNAPRRLLAEHAAKRGKPLFEEVIGPLGSPAQSLAALQDKRVDLIALDSFYLDLLRHAEPRALDGLIRVALTPWTPMPLLVASTNTPSAIVDRLSSKLLGLEIDPSYGQLLKDVLLKRFVKPDVDSFKSLEQMAEAAWQLDYGTIE